MIDYSIKNPLVVNLFLFLVVVIGIVSWQSMPEEMFPVVEKDAIKIITEYEAQNRLEIFRKKSKEYLCPSFNTIAGAGGNAAIVHYRATKNNTKKLTL